MRKTTNLDRRTLILYGKQATEKKKGVYILQKSDLPKNILAVIGIAPKGFINEYGITTLLLLKDGTLYIDVVGKAHDLIEAYLELKDKKRIQKVLDNVYGTKIYLGHLKAVQTLMKKFCLNSCSLSMNSTTNSNCLLYRIYHEHNGCITAEAYGGGINYLLGTEDTLTSTISYVEKYVYPKHYQKTVGKMV